MSNLRDRLGEQGLAPREIEALLPDLERLVAWAPEPPRPEEARRLVATLAAELPAPRRPRLDLDRLIGLALTQATVLRLGFWTGSAAVLLISALLALATPDLSRRLTLLLAGPLLSYLGTAAGFRAQSLHTLEIEFACPFTPRQLMVARLLVIVGYQAIVGLVLSGLLSAAGGGPWAAVTVTWLAPMLAATGATLLASLRLGVPRAGALVYMAWVVVAVMSWRSGLAWASSPAPALILVGLGLGLTAAAVALLPRAIPRALRHA